MSLPYNLNDKQSIIDYAKLLKGKTLREACDNEIPTGNYAGKGKFGQTLEKFYFKYEPNSESEPDFAIAGLELKSTPLKQLNNNDYRSKERLVLNIINYLEVVNQDFETSSFYKKNASILLICYLHQAGYDILDYLIKLVGEWSFPRTDLEIIRKDWELIKKKIADGKAHELSEGDTFYLGACTKGANANTTRKQPFSEIPAKQRAYSFKQGYVNHIIATIANEPTEIYGKLITSTSQIAKKTLTEIVIDKVRRYYGKSVDEISEMTGVKLNLNAKNFYARVTHAMLNIELNKKIEEFEKANIEVKTIRIEQNNDIKQSVSFPAFEFEKIYNEHWISSEMKDIVERKFLFFFFKDDGNNTFRLIQAKFWNMPLADRNEVRKVWLKTKKVIQTGNIFKDYDCDKAGNIRLSIKGNEIRRNNFPKTSESKICHVRPHGNDSTEMFTLPVEDRILQVDKYSKQCFWLNNTYVRDQIYLKE